MGMDADIICVGPFSRKVLDCLNYDKENYENVEEGTPVSATICGCNTTDQSRELGRCVGVEDPYDFSTHHITEDKVNWTALSLMQFEVDYAEKCSQWRRLEILIQNGFTCIYQPNY